MKVLVPVETASRELNYKIILANKLANLGFVVYLGKKKEINYLVSKFKGYIYFDKGYHEGVTEPLHKLIKERGGKIISLDEEGGIDFNDNKIIKNRYSNFLFENANIIFFWGSDQLDSIKNSRALNLNHYVTGHPRFDLLKREMHFLYEKDVEKIRRLHGDFLLINTNMGFGNNIRGEKHIIQNYLSRFPDLYEMIDLDKLKLQAYVKLIKRLSKSFNKKIILRPHPEEKKAFYNNHFSSIPSVEVISHGSVIPWILASDIMIHPDCTTAIESSMLGREPISFLPPSLDNRLFTKEPVEVSTQFTNAQNLIDYIKSIEAILGTHKMIHIIKRFIIMS